MKILGALAVLFVFGSCDFKTGSTTSPAQTQWRSEIDSIMALQENTWNRGDLEAFMDPYWHSDSLIFIGRSGLNYGWETTLSNYKKSYPDKETMGKLEFRNLEYRKTGPDNALVIGRWILYHSQDTLTGSYSLTWQRINGKWKIITDHSS